MTPIPSFWYRYCSGGVFVLGPVTVFCVILFYLSNTIITIEFDAILIPGINGFHTKSSSSCNRHTIICYPPCTICSIYREGERPRDRTLTRMTSSSQTDIDHVATSTRIETTNRSRRLPTHMERTLLVVESRQSEATSTTIQQHQNIHSSILYIGNLDWNITMVDWEYRIRTLLLSSRVFQSPNTTTMELTFRNTTLRPRDIGKYHGGSVLLTFHNLDNATMTYTNQYDETAATTAAKNAMQYMLRIQQEHEAIAITSSSSSSSPQPPTAPLYWIVPLRIQYHHPSPNDASPTVATMSVDELLQLQARRQKRTASYQRRRIRTANTTDHILHQFEQQLLVTGPNHNHTSDTATGWWSTCFATTTSTTNMSTGSPNSRSKLYYNNDNTAIHVLDAPALDWTIVPAIIDPAIGGGLQPQYEGSEEPVQSTIPTSSGLDMNSTTFINPPMTGSSTLLLLHNNSNRATRKRAAVEAFFFAIQHVLLGNSESMHNSSTRTTITTTIADLGCGAGNLALPLAWWLNYYSGNGNVTRPNTLPFRILGIDLNTISLQRLRDRTRQCMSLSSISMTEQLLVETLEMDLLDLIGTRNNNNVSGNANVRKFKNCTAVVSLHACGAASDLAMMAAIQHQLPFAISPCCIGKTLTSRSGYENDITMTNPDSLLSSNTAQNTSSSSSSSQTNSHRIPLTMPTQRGSTPLGIITYPRSKWFQLNDFSYDQYRIIASAADYGVRQTQQPSSSSMDDTDAKDEMCRYQRQRRAKRMIEIDRLQYAYEQGYEVRLLELPRIGPLYTKRELLIGAVRNTPAAERLTNMPSSILKNVY